MYRNIHGRFSCRDQRSFASGFIINNTDYPSLICGFLQKSAFLLVFVKQSRTRAIYQRIRWRFIRSRTEKARVSLMIQSSSVNDKPDILQSVYCQWNRPTIKPRPVLFYTCIANVSGVVNKHTIRPNSLMTRCSRLHARPRHLFRCHVCAAVQGKRVVA